MISEDPSPRFLTPLNGCLLFVFTLLSSYGTTTLYSSSFFVLVPEYNLSLSFATAIAYLTVLISIYLTVAVGYYGDRIVSRYGQRKPLVLAGYTIVCTAFILMAHLSANLHQLSDKRYSTYTADDDTKQSLLENEKDVEVWFAVYQIVAAIGMGLFLIPYSSWFIESTKNSEEYNRIQLIIFNLATGCGSVLALYVLYTIPSKALTISAISYMAGLPLLCILCYTLHNERIRDRPTSKANPILPSLRILWNSHSEFRALFYNKIILSTGEGIGTEFASFVPYILFPSITHYKKLLFLGTVFFYGSYGLTALFTFILKFLIAEPLRTPTGSNNDGSGISRSISPGRQRSRDPMDFKRGSLESMEGSLREDDMMTSCGGLGWDKVTLYRYIIVIFVVICVIEFGITVPSMVQTANNSSDLLDTTESMDLVYVYMSLQIVLSSLFATANRINDLMVRDLVQLDVFVCGKNRANMYQSALSVPPRILVALLISLPQVIFYSTGYEVVNREVEDDPAAYDDLIENKYYWTDASFYEIIVFQNIVAAGLAIMSYLVLKDYNLTQPVADRIESSLRGRDAILERQEVASAMGSMSAVVNVDPSGHPGGPGSVHDNNPFGSMMVDRERQSVLRKVRSRSRDLPFFSLRSLSAFPLTPKGGGAEVLEEVADMMVLHLSEKEISYLLYYWSNGALSGTLCTSTRNMNHQDDSEDGSEDENQRSAELIDMYTLLPPSLLHPDTGTPASTGDQKSATRNTATLGVTQQGGAPGGGNRLRTETEETGEWVEAASPVHAEYTLEAGSGNMGGGLNSNYSSSSTLTNSGSSHGTLLPPPPPVGNGKGGQLSLLFFSRLSTMNYLGLFVVAPIVSILLLASMVMQMQSSSMYTPLVTNLMCLSTGYMFYELLRYTNIQGMATFIRENSAGWDKMKGSMENVHSTVPVSGGDTGEVMNVLQEDATPGEARGLSGIILEPLKAAMTNDNDVNDNENDGGATRRGGSDERDERVNSRAKTVDRSKQESIQIFQSIQLAMEGAMGENRGAMGDRSNGSSFDTGASGMVTLDMERDSDFGAPLGYDGLISGAQEKTKDTRKRTHTGLSSLSAASYGHLNSSSMSSTTSSAKLYHFYTLLWQSYYRHIVTRAPTLKELVEDDLITSVYTPSRRRNREKHGASTSNGDNDQEGVKRECRSWVEKLLGGEFACLPSWIRGYMSIYCAMIALLVVALVFIVVV